MSDGVKRLGVWKVCGAELGEPACSRWTGGVASHKDKCQRAP